MRAHNVQHIIMIYHLLYIIYTIYGLVKCPKSRAHTVPCITRAVSIEFPRKKNTLLCLLSVLVGCLAKLAATRLQFWQLNLKCYIKYKEKERERDWVGLPQWHFVSGIWHGCSCTKSAPQIVFTSSIYLFMQLNWRN